MKIRHLLAGAALVALASCEAPTDRKLWAAEMYAGAAGTYALNNYATSNDDEVEAGDEQFPAGHLILGADLTRWAFVEGHLGLARADFHGVNDGNDCAPPPAGCHQARGEIRSYYLGALVGLRAPLPYVQPYVALGPVGAIQDADGTVDDDQDRLVSAEVGYQGEVGVQVPLGDRVVLRGALQRLWVGAIQQDRAVAGVVVRW